MYPTEKTFERIDLTGQHPPGICRDCAAMGLEHRPSGSVFAYCTHQKCGAMRAPGRAWIQAAEVSAKDFRAADHWAVSAKNTQSRRPVFGAFGAAGILFLGF